MTVFPILRPNCTAVTIASGRGGVGRDHLEQRHLLHRREEVHAEHALGPPAAAAISRIGMVEVLVAKIASGRVDRLDLGQHLLLELQILEHRLDHQVGAARSRR